MCSVEASRFSLWIQRPIRGLLDILQTLLRKFFKFLERGKENKQGELQGERAKKPGPWDHGLT